MIVKGQRQDNRTLHHCIAGFISTIWLFVASRTADLPIVSLQDDVGTIDILSKVYQAGIVVAAAYVINSNKVLKAIPRRQCSKGSE